MPQKNQSLIKTTESSQQFLSATDFLNKSEQKIYLSGPRFPWQKKKKSNVEDISKALYSSAIIR